MSRAPCGHTEAKGPECVPCPLHPTPFFLSEGGPPLCSAHPSRERVVGREDVKPAAGTQTLRPYYGNERLGPDGRQLPRGAGRGPQPWCLPGSHSNAELRVQREGCGENKGTAGSPAGQGKGEHGREMHCTGPQWALRAATTSLPQESFERPKETRRRKDTGGGGARGRGKGWRRGKERAAGAGVQGPSVLEPPAHC